jgi:hypothetical protein
METWNHVKSAGYPAIYVEIPVNSFFLCCKNSAGIA